MYLYTQDQSKHLTSALRAEIRAYFANIDPLTLTLSEVFQVVNKQLHLMIAYRLVGHCLPVETLNLFEKDIWRALQRSSITPKVSPMDRPEAGSDPRGHLRVTWGVYLCAGKPPLADIILSRPPELTRCDSVIGLAIPAMSGHIQYRGAASGDLYIRISGINRVLLS